MAISKLFTALCSCHRPRKPTKVQNSPAIDPPTKALPSTSETTLISNSAESHSKLTSSSDLTLHSIKEAITPLESAIITPSEPPVRQSTISPVLEIKRIVPAALLDSLPISPALPSPCSPPSPKASPTLTNPDSDASEVTEPSPSNPSSPTAPPSLRPPSNQGINLSFTFTDVSQAKTTTTTTPTISAKATKDNTTATPNLEMTRWQESFQNEEVEFLGWGSLGRITGDDEPVVVTPLAPMKRPSQVEVEEEEEEEEEEQEEKLREEDGEKRIRVSQGSLGV